MSNVKCNAKDPSTCRYHRPDAGTVAKAALEEVKTRYEAIQKRMDSGEDVASEYYDARWGLEKAENAYYGTEEGIADISARMEKETDENEKFDLEMKLASAKFALADAERMNAINTRNGGPLIPAEHTYTPGTVKGGGDSLWPTAVGSKYDSTLKTSQIKARVNADIKEAQRKGYLPKHVNFALRSRGNALYVSIIGAADEQVYEDPTEMRRNHYTKPARELLERVEGMVRSYQSSQYDTIESRTNMTNFWDNVSYESNWEKNMRLEKEEKSAAKREAKKSQSV